MPESLFFLISNLIRLPFVQFRGQGRSYSSTCTFRDTQQEKDECILHGDVLRAEGIT